MRVLISGTGTDVGKTHVTACLLALGRARGVRVGAWKPFASGVVDGAAEDALVHARALGAPALPPAYSLVEPLSPHLAARREGVSIDLDLVAARVDELARSLDVLFVEGAGGLFSPINEREGHVELVARLRPEGLLLVASDRLGVLHDVRATLVAARASGVDAATVVLSRPAAADASTGTNADELERLGVARVAAVFPRAAFDAPESLESAAEAWRALGLPERSLSST